MVEWCGRKYPPTLFFAIKAYYGSRVELLWRHKGRDNVSNNQPHDCLLNR